MARRRYDSESWRKSTIVPVGVVEAQKSDAGENITMLEEQSARYADSTFKWIRQKYRIWFAYEATDKLVRFTDYDDIKYRSRSVFSFHRPETLKSLLAQNDTVRNHMKHFPELDATGFLQCQINAIHNLDISFAENRPKAYTDKRSMDIWFAFKYAILWQN